MDLSLLHTLNRFAAGHDGFEDVLNGYVGASQVIFAGLLAFGFVALGPQGRRSAVAAGASLVIALLVAHVLAGIVDRPRPFVAHPVSVHLFSPHAADPSFPSEHATAAFAIAMAVWLRNRAWGAVLLVLAAILALGRVALGLHYPADVIAGAVLGMTVATALHVSPARRWLDRLADALTDVYGRVVRSSS
jgi:undecaprenyl-diphosphatase